MARKPTETSVPAIKEEDNSQLPAFMQGERKYEVGNLDTSDLIIPRVKLLQGTSPEVTAFNDAKQGQFWHTIASMPLGEELRVIPILVRKSIVLWAPRGDDRGILARSNDSIHWDIGANEKFEVKPKKSNVKVTYETKGSVPESGLAEFGTSVPSDPNSPPAASTTYNWMFHLLDYPEISPVIVINTRSSVKPARSLYSKLKMRGGEHFGQIYTMSIVQEQGEDGPFFNYSYESAGYLQDEALYKQLEDMHVRFVQDTGWKTNDDEEDVADKGGNGGGSQGGNVNKTGKF